MEKAGLSSDDIDLFIPHQSNLRINQAFRKSLKIPEDKIYNNIQKYGNTTTGTIPLCLWEWEDQLKKGDNIILSAFGGGFTWGSVYVKWAY